MIIESSEYLSIDQGKPIRYTFSADVAAGVTKKEADDFFLGAAADHWTSQPECLSYEVYANVLAGGPDRVVVMEVENLAALQTIFGRSARQLQPRILEVSQNRRTELYWRIY